MKKKFPGFRPHTEAGNSSCLRYPQETLSPDTSRTPGDSTVNAGLDDVKQTQLDAKKQGNDSKKNIKSGHVGKKPSIENTNMNSDTDKMQSDDPTVGEQGEKEQKKLSTGKKFGELKT